MASDLLSIARSGTKAARTALDLTAQNITNAATDGYVRRSVSLEEVSSASSGTARTSDVSLSGVRLDTIVRNADAFRQAEVRRTASDSARANAEVDGLQTVESAVEEADVYSSVTEFEASLQQLTSDPTSGSLRAAVVESARALGSSFNIAANSLDSAGTGINFAATDAVTQVNAIAGQLTRVNQQLTRVSTSSSDQSALLDQRDLLLQKLSGYTDVSTTFNADKSVFVRLGGSSGPTLVGASGATALTMATASDGTISFTLGTTAVAPSAGSLAGNAQALTKLKDVRASLNTIAGSLISTLNSAQASGVALDGTTGQPLFSGTNASNIAVSLTSGSGLATAPAGAAAGSRDASNLSTMRSALATANPAGATDALLFDISSTVAGRTLTRDALSTIASSANTALQAQSGVDLDEEAVNLIRYQQAFQASSKVMQVATDIFNTLLGIN